MPSYSYSIRILIGHAFVVAAALAFKLIVIFAQNNKDEDTTISRPKLMISDFYTDIEEVKAGNVFDFTFELLNTNDEIAAKNIKAIVTSSDGTFSVTAGGNSFFVKEIKPGGNH